MTTAPPPEPPPAAAPARALRVPGGWEGWATAAAVLVGSLLAGLWVVGGPVRHLSSRYVSGPGGPGDGFFQGDTFELTYHWWNWVHQLARLGNPFDDPFSYGALVGHIPSQFGWPFAPLFGVLAAGGIPFAFNVILLLTFPLAAGATYLWLRSTGLGRAGSAVGGLVYAFFPARVVRLVGHYVAWLAVLLPVALWMAERAARARTERGRILWGLGFTVTMLTIAQAGELYFTLFATLIAISYVVLRLRMRLVRDRSYWFLIGGIALTLLTILVVREWLVADSFWSGGRPLFEAQVYSPEPGNFFRRDLGLGAEKFAYLGIVALAAVPLGILAAWRRRLTWFCLGWAVVVLVFSLGTSTRVFTFLHEHTPFLNFARSVTRPLPLAGFAFAFLAGVAVHRGLGLVRDGRVRPVAGAVAAAVVGVVVAWDASVMVFGSWRVDGLDAQRELLRGREGSVLSAPVFDAANTVGVSYMYATMRDPRASANGYSPYTPKAAVERQRALQPVDCGVLGAAQRRALTTYGIRFIVLYPMFYGTPWSFWSPGLAAGTLDRTPGVRRLGDWRGVGAWEVDAGALARSRQVTMSPEDLGPNQPATSVAPCTGWASPAADGVWSQGHDAYLWAIRRPGEPAPVVRLQSGPIANRARYGLVDGPRRAVDIPPGGEASISLPLPADGRWRPVVIDPLRAFNPFGKDGPERRGVKLVYPLPPIS